MIRQFKNVSLFVGGAVGALLFMFALGAGRAPSREAPDAYEFFEVGTEYWACSSHLPLSRLYSRSTSVGESFCQAWVEFTVEEKRAGLLRIALTSDSGANTISAWVNPDWFPLFDERVLVGGQEN